jgi:biopolymer transport protein ExbD
MKLKNKEKREYEDDGLLPLVNIIFLLLIFFMIVGVIEKNIVRDNMQLPKVELDKFENKDITKIFYDADKNIFINDENINIGDIGKKIKALKVTDVILVADKSLLISEINSVLLELNKNQINNIKLLSTLNAN